MASWPGIVDALDLGCITAFGVPATLHSQTAGDISITGIIAIPAMGEDFVPGSPQGVNVVRFFVRFADISTPPQKGDTLTLNGILYNIFDPVVDVEGGAILKMRKA